MQPCIVRDRVERVTAALEHGLSAGIFLLLVDLPHFLLLTALLEQNVRLCLFLLAVFLGGSCTEQVVAIR